MKRADAKLVRDKRPKYGLGEERLGGALAGPLDVLGVGLLRCGYGPGSRTAGGIDHAGVMSQALHGPSWASRGGKPPGVK